MQNPKQAQGANADLVKHPSAEQWMGYLYGEGSRSEKAALAAHLEACSACDQTVARWRTAMADLSAWPLVRMDGARSSPAAYAAFKWALAALFVLGLGYGIGRFSPPATPSHGTPPSTGWTPSEKAALIAEVKQQVRAEFLADWRSAIDAEPAGLTSNLQRQLRQGMDQWAAKAVAHSTAENQRLLLEFSDRYRAERQRDQRALLTLFEQTEQKRDAECLSLRRAVETVALVADDKFQRTDTELGHLASYTQAKYVPQASYQPAEDVNTKTRKENQ
jgi:hypothetical protein